MFFIDPLVFYGWPTQYLPGCLYSSETFSGTYCSLGRPDKPDKLNQKQKPSSASVEIWTLNSWMCSSGVGFFFSERIPILLPLSALELKKKCSPPQRRGKTLKELKKKTVFYHKKEGGGGILFDGADTLPTPRLRHWRTGTPTVLPLLQCVSDMTTVYILCPVSG